MIVEMASEEADSLISLLGLIPIQVCNLQHTNVVLPGIESWLSHPPLDCDTNDDDTSLLSYDEEILLEAEHLQLLLDCEEDHTLFCSKAQESEIMNLTCAALALVTDEITNMCVLALTYFPVCFHTKFVYSVIPLRSKMKKQ